jgi:starvation-inducible DNA-binding protein
MDELVKSMEVSLANTFVFYFKAHSFHWNVEGIHFPTYHEFFGELYEDLYGAVDPMAEEIRALNAYAPKGLNELYSHSTVVDSDIIGDNVNDMLMAALADNTVVLQSLTASFTLATRENKQGLANFLADRIDAHKKHEWMIRSCMKGAH